jgi:2-polyprenyl-3-methyl-5-hydroxy-6-metoxy-1,4-benzoquinol methylase
MSEEALTELRTLVQSTQAAWEEKAAFWDGQMGDGNQFHRVLVGPSVERLLGIRPGERVLDVACGNGVMSRWLAQLGATVVACDFSPTFLERARARDDDQADKINYHLVDATDSTQLLALGVGQFDAAVCTMALHDIPTIDPLLHALGQLLTPDGRFVFAVPHPCFNAAGGTTVVLEEDLADTLTAVYAVKVYRYLSVPVTRDAGMVGATTTHENFHRPLHTLLGACFAAGFVLDGLEEPAFGPGDQSSRPLGWANVKGIPPVLVARLRRACSGYTHC